MPLKKKNQQEQSTTSNDDDLKIAKVKATLARAAAMGNKAAIRMTMPNPKSMIFKTDEGDMGKGTHYVATFGNYVVPILQEGEDGKMFYNKNASPRDKEAIKFDTEEDAAYFAKNYKRVAPMMRESRFLKKEGNESKPLDVTPKMTSSPTTMTTTINKPKMLKKAK